MSLRFYVRALNQEMSIDVNFDIVDIRRWCRENKNSIDNTKLELDEKNNSFGFEYQLDERHAYMAPAVVATLWDKALERLVQIKPLVVTAKTTKTGTLTAEVCSDVAYPTIYTYIRCGDKNEVDLFCAEDTKYDGVKGFLFEDTSVPFPNKEISWSSKQIKTASE